METPHIGTGNGTGSKATQFKPGWKGGPGRPCASKNEEPARQMNPLEDMLHVYTNPPSKDKTPGQKGCRQFREKNYKGFIALLMKHMKLAEVTRSDAAAAATPGSEETHAIVEKEERVETLIEQLLAEWEEEDGRQNAVPRIAGE